MPEVNFDDEEEPKEKKEDLHLAQMIAVAYDKAKDGHVPKTSPKQNTEPYITNISELAMKDIDLDSVLKANDDSKTELDLEDEEDFLFDHLNTSSGNKRGLPVVPIPLPILCPFDCTVLFKFSVSIVYLPV